MRNLLRIVIAFGVVFSTFPMQVSSVAAQSVAEDNSGAVVCPPDVYLQPPSDCLPLGPSEYLTEMAHLGITFPLQTLPASPTDASLKNLPYYYFRADSVTGVSFYPSLEAAQARENASQVIAPGSILYIAYDEAVEVGKGTYFRLPSGDWMRPEGENASRVSLPQHQAGLEFQMTPHTRFGWILDLDPQTPVRREPNLQSEQVSMLTAYDVVQIYLSQNVEGTDWDMIGPNQWVESRRIAALTPNTTPPDGVTNGRWVDVDLAEQTLGVYDNSQLVFATIMASGLEPLWTRPGLFQIYQKKETETMSGERGTSEFYYLEDVPWTMYFDKARALHGAYWRARLGYPQSHGCVNMFIGDAHWLFNWAHEGDWVYVHDPSGKTPTDPSAYGDGGGS